MADSIPEELRSFGVTSKDFDDKEGVLTKTKGNEVDEKGRLFKPFSRFGNKSNKSNKLSNIADALLEYGSLQG